MIIKLSDTPINQRAIRALLVKTPNQIQLSFQDLTSSRINPLVIDPQDRTLTVVDLNANGNLQTLYAPGVMAKKLTASGLLAHITTIQLLASDIVPNRSLLGFATALSQHLLVENPDAMITIRVPADLIEATLIEPPEDSTGKWTMYSADRVIAPTQVLPNAQAAFDFYRAQMKPKLLFQGDIEVQLKKKQYEISPQTVRTTYETDSSSTSFDLKL